MSKIHILIQGGIVKILSSQSNSDLNFKNLIRKVTSAKICFYVLVVINDYS